MTNTSHSKTSPVYLITLTRSAKFYLRDSSICDQVTHPDIIKFNNGYKVCSHTYKFAMAMTPYPFYNEKYENPYVVVANTENTFIEDCIPNPIEPYPGKNYHNSDPEIVYVGGSFYLFWRLRQISTNKAWLLLRKSKDLVNWSEKQVVQIMFTPLSPAIVYDGKWKMWGVNEANWRVAYFESDDGVSWKFVDYTNIPSHINWSGSKLICWHLDIKKTVISKQYFALIVYASGSGGAAPSFLFFAESDDGFDWKLYRKPILLPFMYGNQYVDKVYRSTFIIEQGKIKVWYSFASRGTLLRKLNITLFGRRIGVGRWGVGYAEGDLSDYVSDKDRTLNVIL